MSTVLALNTACVMHRSATVTILLQVINKPINGKEAQAGFKQYESITNPSLTQLRTLRPHGSFSCLISYLYDITSQYIRAYKHTNLSTTDTTYSTKSDNEVCVLTGVACYLEILSIKWQ